MPGTQIYCFWSGDFETLNFAASQIVDRMFFLLTSWCGCKKSNHTTHTHTHFKVYSLLHLSEVGFRGSKVLTTTLQPDSCLPSYKALRFLEFITLWLISSSPSCQTLPPPPLNIVTFLGGICRQAIRASAAACRDQTGPLVLHLRPPCPSSLLLCHFPRPFHMSFWWLMCHVCTRMPSGDTQAHLSQAGRPEDCFILGRVHSFAVFQFSSLCLAA